MDDRIRKTLSDAYDGQKNKNDGYYVYMLCDTSSGSPIPFYIGKGIYDRVCQHEKDANIVETEIANLKDELKANSDFNEEQIKQIISMQETEITEKCAVINKLLEKGCFEKYIVKWGLTDHEAFMVESALINAYGLTQNEKLTNIVNGHMSNREKMNHSKTTKAWELDDFERECAYENKDVTEIENKVVFIKLNNSTYSQCYDNSDKLYEISRGFWKIGDGMKKHLEYAVVLYESQVIAVYKINKMQTRKAMMDGIENKEELYKLFENTLMFRDKEIDFMWKLYHCDTVESAKEKLGDANFLEFSKSIRADDEENNFKHMKKYNNDLKSYKSYSKFKNDINVLEELKSRISHTINDYKGIDEEEYRDWWNRKIFDGELLARELVEDNDTDTMSNLYRKVIQKPKCGEKNQKFNGQNPIFYNINSKGNIKKAEEYYNIKTEE